MKDRPIKLKITLCLVTAMIFLLASGCSNSSKADETANSQENGGELNQVMYVNTNSTRIRSGPGESYDVESLLAKGESVVVTEAAYDSDENSWYKIDPESLSDDIELSGENYYILASLLTDNKPES